MVKAIETKYAGCRFRSRTEARWAVFFDHIGLKWEFEREGYELPSGRYLPDFWLPKMDAWLEVKGGDPTLDEIRKAIDLAQMTERRVFIAHGAPEADGPKLSLVEVGMGWFPAADIASRWMGYLPAGRAVHAARESAEHARSARFEFGQTPAPPTPALAGLARASEANSRVFAAGDAVVHATKFGNGEVLEVFELPNGRKKLRIKFAGETDPRMVISTFVERVPHAFR